MTKPAAHAVVPAGRAPRSGHRRRPRHRPGADRRSGAGRRACRAGRAHRGGDRGRRRRNPRRRRQCRGDGARRDRSPGRARGDRGAARVRHTGEQRRHQPAAADFLEVTEDDYDTITTLNLRAAFFVAQAVARRMVEAGRQGIDHPHLLADGPCRRRAPHRLLHHQARHRGADQGDGDRSRAARHQGEFHRSDLHRYAVDRAVLAGQGVPGRHAAADQAGPARARWRT